MKKKLVLVYPEEQDIQEIKELIKNQNIEVQLEPLKKDQFEAFLEVIDERSPYGT